MNNKNFYPKVSIVIPVYNGSNYVGEAIDSALAQTYKNIEIVVVNDGSIDDGKTEEVCKSYGDKIRYFRKENGGVATALNYGIEKMEGEYFSWLSHDDLYFPTKVEEEVKILASDGDAEAVVFSDFCEVDSNVRMLRKIRLADKVARCPRVFLALETDSYIHGCSLLVPKALFKKYGKFQIDKRCTQDYYMWFLLATHTKFLHVKKVLVKSRVHSQQDSFKLGDEKRLESDILREYCVSSLSNEEFLNYSSDINFYWNIYHLYKNGEYEYFPIALVNKMHEAFCDNIEVSVIVPVYNVEKYISKCLDSLIEQTFMNFEVVIVNDGTKDSSAEIAKKYSDRCSSFIKLINKSNGGLGSARNEGLRHVKGKYVGYVDSDDYVDPKMFGKLYRKIVQGYDIVMSGFNLVDNATMAVIKDHEMPEDIDFRNIREIIKNSTLRIPPSAWNKLFKRELLDKIGWGNGFYEDLQATPTYFSYAENIGLVNEPLYFYRVNRQGSIMSSKRKDARNLSFIDAWRNLLLKSNKKYKNEIGFAIYVHIWDVMQVYPAFIEKFKSFFDENAKIFKNNPLIKEGLKGKYIRDLFSLELIPKKIHYIWFGDGELSDLNKRCIESWKKYAPDYEIVMWNEKNCDMSENQYVKEAYDAKKWAFIADYFRFKIIYEEGGIYVDTDTEFNNNIEELRAGNAFFAFEKNDVVHGGIFGAAKGNTLIKELLDSYKDQTFVDPVTGTLATSNPIPQRITKILREKYNLKCNGKKQFLPGNIGIYPFNILTIDCNDGKNIAEHHYDYSWGEVEAVMPYKYYVTREYFKNLFSEEALMEKGNTKLFANVTLLNTLVKKLKRLPSLIKEQGFFLTMYKILKKVFKIIFSKISRKN